jgi:L-lactate dehydrogenase complex protein LldF
VSAGETIWTDDPPFPENAKRAVNDAQLRRNIRNATSTIRARRASVVAELPDWQQLRDAGAAIKDEVLRDLDRYLEQFEEDATRRGARVHWARDADQANSIVASLVAATGEREVIKVKSMATEEIGLVSAFAKQGITAYETDLAELIVQLGHDRPSHILVPAIHKNRAEIREIFLREMGDAPPDLSDDPHALAEAARRHLRRKFIEAKVAVSGANFAVAETGSLLVAESEGNGRMCLTLPRTLISVVGIEKLVPSFQDLEVFLQLLPRSSTGERMNPYSSLWTGVTPGDGPQEVHIVLLDNGRTQVLRDEIGRQALRRIRCSACLNVCPVYERTGGHAYDATYPGPIGVVLTPQLVGVEHASELSFASSLCGYCYEVCPVKIDIPTVLVKLRHDSIRVLPPPGAGRAVRGRGRDEGSPAMDAGAPAGQADAVHPARGPAAAVPLDPGPRSPRPTAPPVPRLVGREQRRRAAAGSDGSAAVSARQEILARVREAIGPAGSSLRTAYRRAGSSRPSRSATHPGWIPKRSTGRDGVLTTCAVAVAQTGTIVLDGSAGMGRQVLSLVPDYHLCVVRAEQIVSCISEAIAKLDPALPLTFISGPSATVDIEMVRVAGVPAPRRLEVIVAE